ncbi:hypothetical protein AB7179_08780 [Providencia manganoxydans]|uniref:hypothetical protein n=1 Tax=Providencia manganoxydans TaxID=2923283 RepID=UPI0034E530A1
MNIDMFHKLFTKQQKIAESLLNICENNNSLVTVLTLHLICENFLESYICSCLEIEDLFSESPTNKDNVKFRMSFEHKAKLAQRLGMDRNAYEAFERLNQIRNNFSHRLLNSEIPNEQLKKITKLINLVKNRKDDITLDSEHVIYRDSDKNIIFKYEFSSSETPDSMKLVIAYLSLIRRVAMSTNLLTVNWD